MSMKYKCKNCGYLSRANSFEEIVENEKLCKLCKQSDAKERTRRKFNSSPAGKAWSSGKSPKRETKKELKESKKKVIKLTPNWFCNHCGNIQDSETKPHKCKSCGSTALKQLHGQG